MFVSYKRFFAIILIILSAVFTASGVVAANNFPKTKIARIVIDAGHGGFDGGVVGKVTKAKESDLNLRVTNFLADYLKKAKVDVVLTRIDAGSVASTKKADMQKRKEIISNAKPDLVVSIHMNHFPESYRRGTQVFFDDTGIGKPFGDYVQGVMNTHINTPYTGKTYAALGADLFLTKCHPCPSLVVECGFLSNPEDEKLLVSSSYQKKLASLLSTAILGWITGGTAV